MADPLRFFLDQHVPSAVSQGPRLRGVDVLTAQSSPLSCPPPTFVATPAAHSSGRTWYTYGQRLLTSWPSFLAGPPRRAGPRAWRAPAAASSGDVAPPSK